MAVLCLPEGISFPTFVLPIIWLTQPQGLYASHCSQWAKPWLHSLAERHKQRRGDSSPRSSAIQTHWKAWCPRDVGRGRAGVSGKGPVGGA